MVALLFFHHQLSQLALQRIEFRRGRIARARQVDQEVALDRAGARAGIAQVSRVHLDELLREVPATLS